MGAWVEWAIERRNAARAEYQNYVWNQYHRAEEDTNGAFLNARGQRLRVDSFELFSGPTVRAYAYASEELVEWWATHGRMTFEEWERHDLSNYLGHE